MIDCQAGSWPLRGRVCIALAVVFVLLGAAEVWAQNAPPEGWASDGYVELAPQSLLFSSWESDKGQQRGTFYRGAVSAAPAVGVGNHTLTVSFSPDRVRIRTLLKTPVFDRYASRMQQLDSPPTLVTAVRANYATRTLNLSRRDLVTYVAPLGTETTRLLGVEVDFTWGNTVPMYFDVRAALPLGLAALLAGILLSEAREKSRRGGWIEIELLDEAGDPVAGEAYRVTLPTGVLREGVLDAQGRARIDRLPPGPCQVSFPGIDGAAWDRDQSTVHA
jgi:hypothetical protein